MVGQHSAKNRLPRRRKAMEELVVFGVHLKSMSAPKTSLSDCFINGNQNLLNRLMIKNPSVTFIFMKKGRVVINIAWLQGIRVYSLNHSMSQHHRVKHPSKFI